MRSARSCVWLSVFLFAASAPAFCQVIFPPNGSGFRIAADAPTMAYQQSVFSTGPFDVGLAIFQNGQLRFAAAALVCTSGPVTNVSINVPFGSFGLHSGDTILFAFTVRHRTTEGGTWSAILSVIPVGPAAGSPSSSPPPSQTRLESSSSGDFARWARREESSVG